jgi:hypothetical protein
VCSKVRSTYQRSKFTTALTLPTLCQGKTSGRGSLTKLQRYGAVHEHQSYSDMSGVQLDDGAFVLRWCPPPCAPLLAHTPYTPSPPSMDLVEQMLYRKRDGHGQRIR